MIVMDTNRYRNGKVYKITDNAYTKCYVGSTCESLSQRMARHRKEYRNYLKGCKYFITSFNIFNEFGIDNCKIELLENCPCDTVEELRKREGHYKQSLDCVNKQTPGRTQAEYREQNREQINQQKRDHYWKNKDAISESKKHKYTCACGSVVGIGGKAEHERSKKHQRFLGNICEEEEEEKQRRERKKQQTYHEKLERNKVKYTCCCGSTLRRGDKASHEKTIKHLQYLQSIEDAIKN